MSIREWKKRYSDINKPSLGNQKKYVGVEN